MKKRFLFIIAAAALIMSACAKESREGIVPAGPKEFTASVEQSIPELKASLDDNKSGIVWKNGDVIKIFSSTVTDGADFTATTPEEQPSKYAKFNGATDMGAAPYAAYYPSDANLKSYDAVNKTFQVVIPQSQTYVEGNIAEGSLPMVACINAGTNLSFKNAGGIVCVRVQSFSTDFYVDKVTLVAPEEGDYLSGEAQIVWTGNAENPVDIVMGQAAVTEFSGVAEGWEPDPSPITYDPKKTISLDCSAADGGNGVKVQRGTYTDFYIAVPAVGTYSNMKVQIKKKDGAVLQLTSSNDVVIKRSYLTTFKMTMHNAIDLSYIKYIDEVQTTQETANCYVITTPGEYKFPVTVMGNGAAGLAGGFTSAAIDPASIKKAKVIWSDNTNPVNTEIPLTIKDGYLTFVSSNTLAGNALIGVFSTENCQDGTCLWSWHIWGCADLAEVTPATGYTFLDRNLGAIQVAYNTETGNGFFYQWGRKDPFKQQTGNLTDSSTPWSFSIANDGAGATIEESIKNPGAAYCKAKDLNTSWTSDNSTDLWCKGYSGTGYADAAVAKTIFDPCPAGYHVMSVKAAKAIVTLDATNFDADKGIWRPDNNGMFQPSAGYRFSGYSDIYNQGGSFSYSFHWWVGFPAGDEKGYDFQYSSATASFGKNLGFLVRAEKEN